MLDSVDGILLMQVWDRLNLPDVFSEAWQPLIDAATASQDTPPRDPAGFSAWLAGELSVPVRCHRSRAHAPPLTSDADSTAVRRDRLSRFLDWLTPLLAPVAVDGVQRLGLGVRWTEVGSVAAEDLDPLLPGVLDRLGHEVSNIAVTSPGHRDVRRRSTGGLTDGDVRPIYGLALCPVDRGGVGELDELGRVLGRNHAVTSPSAERQAPVVAEPIPLWDSTGGWSARPGVWSAARSQEGRLTRRSQPGQGLLDCRCVFGWDR